jgi:hypothetical protein
LSVSVYRRVLSVLIASGFGRCGRIGRRAAASAWCSYLCCGNFFWQNFCMASRPDGRRLAAGRNLTVGVMLTWTAWLG